MLHLARRGEFEAFLHTALGLELGHFRLLAVRRYRPALAALVARQILHSIVRRRAPSGIRTKRQAGQGYRIPAPASFPTPVATGHTFDHIFDPRRVAQRADPHRTFGVQPRLGPVTHRPAAAPTSATQQAAE